jgi:murein DD-endopeptidase MepM/ murein hydrolase activator NlpD
MLRTIRKTSLPIGRLVKGVAATLMTASLIAPALAQQQSVKDTRTLSEATGMHHEQLSIYEKIVRNRLEAEAKTTAAGASATVAANETKADASAAKTAIAGLGNVTKLDDSALRKKIDATKVASDELALAGAEADRKAAEAAAAAAQALALSNTPEGAKATARSLAASLHGWGDGEFQCLSNLWQKESGWNYRASNGGSGATGIPQALPGSKMATAGADWQTSAATQIKWGLDYIARGYGSPCSAWSHSQSVNWY